MDDTLAIAIYAARSNGQPGLQSWDKLPDYAKDHWRSVAKTARTVIDAEHDSQWETRQDGRQVRKDRWESGIRNIVTILHGPRAEFEIADIVDAVRAMKAAAGRSTIELQPRVAPWMEACFGAEISADKLERGDRLLEEALELLQSGDYPRERIHALIDYVYARPRGEPHQEVGGVMITLAAYCLAHGLDMHQAGEDELARIWTKVEAIRAKQAAKPTGSALPVAVASSADEASEGADCG